MIPLFLAVCAGYGVYLTYTAVALRWTGVGVGQQRQAHTSRRKAGQDWINQAGLAGVDLKDIGIVSGALLVIGVALGFAMFSAIVPAIVIGLLCGSLPALSARSRRSRARLAAQDNWPRMIEEIRIQTSALGRSVPQALFDIGRRAPIEMQPAFDAAHREWLVSTDFSRTLKVLKDLLADPTADMTCETLLIAHELGGGSLDKRLEALSEDRLADVLGRKDARAKQAGVRFARRFVIVVPLGMAFAGMSIGNGRAAYQSATGQLGVVIGLSMTALCWVWAGRLMVLPNEERVFDQ